MSQSTFELTTRARVPRLNSKVFKCLIYSFVKKSKGLAVNNFKSVGEDTFIDEKAYFRRPHLVSIGNKCSIDAGAYITTGAVFGSYVHVGPYVSVIGGESGLLIAEDFSTFAAGSRVVCLGEEHRGKGLIGPAIPSQFRDTLVGGIVKVERFVNVLTNAVILPGVVLAEGSVIGANSVISFDTEPWGVYLGNPARKIKLRDSSRMKEFGMELCKGIVRV